MTNKEQLATLLTEFGIGFETYPESPCQIWNGDRKVYEDCTAVERVSLNDAGAYFTFDAAGRFVSLEAYE